MTKEPLVDQKSFILGFTFLAVSRWKSRQASQKHYYNCTLCAVSSFGFPFRVDMPHAKADPHHWNSPFSRGGSRTAETKTYTSRIYIHGPAAHSQFNYTEKLDIIYSPPPTIAQLRAIFILRNPNRFLLRSRESIGSPTTRRKSIQEPGSSFDIQFYLDLFFIHHI
jgi:hypothetical protein